MLSVLVRFGRKVARLRRARRKIVLWQNARRAFCHKTIFLRRAPQAREGPVRAG